MSLATLGIQVFSSPLLLFQDALLQTLLQLSSYILNAIILIKNSTRCLPVTPIAPKHHKLDHVSIIVHDKSASLVVCPGETYLLGLNIRNARFHERIGRYSPSTPLVQSQSPAEICRDTQSIVVPYNLSPQRPYKLVEILVRGAAASACPGWLRQVSCCQAGQRHCRRDCMSVDTEVF